MTFIQRAHSKSSEVSQWANHDIWKNCRHSAEHFHKPPTPVIIISIFANDERLLHLISLYCNSILTSPSCPLLAVPATCHLAQSFPPSPLILTLRGMHSCWGHSVPLLPSSWSINLQMCASIRVCSCVCVRSMPAKILLACSCFFWVYTAGLCVCICRSGQQLKVQVRTHQQWCVPVY